MIDDTHFEQSNNIMNKNWTMVDYAHDQLESGYYVKNVIQKNKINRFKIEYILYIYVFVSIYVLLFLYILL